MKRSDMQAVTLAGMCGGASAAIAVLENLNNEVCGTANGKGYLGLLPIPTNTEDMKVLKGWGFKYENEADLNCVREHRRKGELSVPVTFPEGWSLKPTGHWLYKQLLDEKGQRRAEVMLHYQDHDSWIRLVPKYRAATWQKNYRHGDPTHPVIEDSNYNVVWIGEATAYEAARDQSTKILAKIKDHDSVNAYFDGTAPKFPKSTYTIPPLRDYSIHTVFYHQGKRDAADQGSDRLRAADDAEAIELAKKGFAGALSGYDISMRLTSPEGKELWSDERRTPTVHRGYRSKRGYSPFDDPMSYHESFR